MGNNYPLVTCFILNWNRKEETVRAINSVKIQSYKNIEILVVDNGSEDGSVNYIKEKCSDIKCIELDKNYGCPGGRNRGIQYCNGDFIFFCDNDGVLHCDAIKNAVKIILSDEKIAVVTGLVKDFSEESEINTFCELLNDNSCQVNTFQGGISLHRKKVYTDISLYPDDYMYGGEEKYLSFRILDNGYKIIKNKDVVLWHKKSIVSRDIKSESVSCLCNQLVNAYQLYPIEYFLSFFLYYMLVYSLYALRYNVFKEFLIAQYSIIKRLKKYKRLPVKRRTYYLYRKIGSSLKCAVDKQYKR